MTWIRVFIHRLRGLFLKRKLEQDLEDEIRSHIDMQIEDNLRQGMSPDEARYEALRKFGGVEQVKESYRDRRSLPIVDSTLQDLRYGVRMLRKHKGFTVVAVLSLALGIGANTAIFSLLDVVLLKSLPVEEPEKLVLFGKGENTGPTDGFPNKSWDLFSYPFYQEVRQHNEVFSDVAALLSIPRSPHGAINTNRSSDETEGLNVQLVSGAYFSVLGVNASLGRAFTEADDQTSGGHPVAVISYAWWERRLGGNPAAVGKTITIGQTVYTIIGVAPKEFFGTTVGQAPDLCCR